jgi:perosamine synthetase
MSDQPIPNCVPELVGREREYLRECVDTGWVSSVGPFVDTFERLFAAYHGTEVAAAVSSGTAAIHLGLLALGVKPGDLVICPSMTFIGTANPIRYCGAAPIFVDAEPATLNMDLSVLEHFLERETDVTEDGPVHRGTGRPIRALVLVHLYGNPADVERAMAIARRHRLRVLEDAAETLGGRVAGALVGTAGDVGCFSFNGNKVITTGGGGMVIARDASLVRLCKHLSTQARSDAFEFEHDEVGYNYRLGNLSAAVGVAQFEHLDTFLAAKRAHAAAYTSGFAREGLWSVVQEPPGTWGTYWMALARRAGPGSILPLLRELAGEGIGVRPVWTPLHRLPLYRDALYWGADASERLFHRVCCLPSSVGLTDAQIERVVRALDARVGCGRDASRV